MAGVTVDMEKVNAMMSWLENVKATLSEVKERLASLNYEELKEMHRRVDDMILTVDNIRDLLSNRAVISLTSGIAEVVTPLMRISIKVAPETSVEQLENGLKNEAVKRVDAIVVSMLKHFLNLLDDYHSLIHSFMELHSRVRHAEEDLEAIFRELRDMRDC